MAVHVCKFELLCSSIAQVIEWSPVPFLSVLLL